MISARNDKANEASTTQGASWIEERKVMDGARHGTALKYHPVKQRLNADDRRESDSLLCTRELLRSGVDYTDDSDKIAASRR